MTSPKNEAKGSVDSPHLGVKARGRPGCLLRICLLGEWCSSAVVADWGSGRKAPRNGLHDRLDKRSFHNVNWRLHAEHAAAGARDRLAPLHLGIGLNGRPGSPRHSLPYTLGAKMQDE